MNNLFGLPTPEEVRSSARRRLFNTLPQYGGGPLGGANMGGAALGMALGSLFAPKSGQEQRAEDVQSIMQKTKATFGEINPADMNQLASYGKQLASNLIQGGQTEYGLKVLKSLESIDSVTGTGGVSKETKSKIRDYIFSNRDALEKQSSLIVESMTGIDKLAQAAAKGNRSARGALLQRVAKLAQGAGVVTDRDASAVAGDMNATAALLAAVLPNVDVDMKALMRSADPVGEGFNTENLLNVADALVASGTQTVNNRMSDLKEQALEAEFSPQGTKAMFAGTRNINALNKLGENKRSVQDATKTNSLDARAKALNL